MTLRFQDGFDFYSVTNDMALQQGSGNFVWDTVVASPGLVLSATTRFSTGQSIIPNGASSTSLTKAWGFNDTTFTFCFAEDYAAALSGSAPAVGFVFSDGATAQCGLWGETDGFLRLRAGGTSAGAVLAAYSGAFLANQWNQYQCKITIDNAAGAIHIRKNGSLVDDFSATGLDTQASANAYANKLSVITAAGGVGANFRLDDFVLFSNDATAPNDWISDVRIVQQMSNANPASPVFLPSPTTIQIGNPGLAGSSAAQTAGNIRYHKIVPTRSGTLTKITWGLQAALVGSVKCALYADNGSGTAPTTLLSDTNQLVNPSAGALDFTLTTPQSIVAGTSYWVAEWHSASATTFLSSTTVTQSIQAIAYTGTFPSSATPTPNGTTSLNIYATYSPLNFSLISDPTEDGDSTYIYSSTVNDQDLYGIAALAATPSSIVSVVAKMFCHKSDSGARSGALQVKSGITTVNGTSTVLSSTGGYLTQQFALDPNTGLPFTETGVNNLTPGPKVTA